MSEEINPRDRGNAEPRQYPGLHSRGKTLDTVLFANDDVLSRKTTSRMAEIVLVVL